MSRVARQRGIEPETLRHWAAKAEVDESCGLRAAEVCSLRPESVIRRDRQAHLLVHGKGERDRLVPLPPALLGRIENYIRSGRPSDTKASQLFPGLRRGRMRDYEPLTPSGILQLVSRATDRAGVTKRVYTHLLRHNFITNALRSGMSPILWPRSPVTVRCG